MPEEKAERRHLPQWAKKVLLVISIVGPLTGAAVTIVSGYYDINAKAKSAKAQTKASYETLAPAVKELQDLLSRAIDADEIDEREISTLKADRDAQEKRILRLEAYVDILSNQRNLPNAPPPVAAETRQPVARVRKIKPPERPIPVDVGGANQYQKARAELKCLPGDPVCDSKAADMAAD
ncbi:MAG: hypothetical protein E4H01_11555 [Lysobacterales bacterium]|nr:MAG: hypothetical protein E4H01_11555 [Xanthomonadales bacterium]